MCRIFPTATSFFSYEIRITLNQAHSLNEVQNRTAEYFIQSAFAKLLVPALGIQNWDMETPSTSTEVTGVC